MLTTVRHIFGRIMHSETALCSQWDKGWKNNLLFASPSIRRPTPGNRKCGPHALRSSLASSMVNDDIPYETVRKVLGHSSNNAIKHYARIDIEKLRRYSLAPPAPASRFHAFLYGEVK